MKIPNCKKRGCKGRAWFESGYCYKHHMEALIKWEEQSRKKKVLARKATT